MAVHLASTKSSRTYRISRLRPGNPAAHRTSDLPLLPSGPDGVHRLLLRGTQSSTPLNPAGLTKTGLGLELNPAIAGCRLQGTATSPSSTATNLTFQTSVDNYYIIFPSGINCQFPPVNNRSCRAGFPNSPPVSDRNSLCRRQRRRRIPPKFSIRTPLPGLQSRCPSQ